MVIPFPSLRSTLAFSVWLTEVTFGAEGKREEYDTKSDISTSSNGVCMKSGVATCTEWWYGWNTSCTLSNFPNLRFRTVHCLWSYGSPISIIIHTCTCIVHTVNNVCTHIHMHYIWECMPIHISLQINGKLSLTDAAVLFPASFQATIVMEWGLHLVWSEASTMSILSSLVVFSYTEGDRGGRGKEQTRNKGDEKRGKEWWPGGSGGAREWGST